ncbi:MAG: DUF1801 domain-containing protein [Gemmatimonadaceae bacterium]
MPAFTSVDAYLAAQPRAVQPILRRVRAAIQLAIPNAEEVITYQMPTYKVNGKAVIYFAGWKAHYSLYPVTRVVAEKFEKQLALFDVQKGTVRFPLDKPVPEKLIAGIARLRASEALAGKPRLKKTKST